MPESLRPIVPLKVSAAGATDIGRVRDHNEDAVLLRPDVQLFVLADGAGGHNAGNVASALAVTSLAHFWEATQQEALEKPRVGALGIATAARRLSRAIQQANREIVEIAKTSNKYQGMGTTIVAAAFDPQAGLLHLAHVGDSRCYRMREGRLESLTEDHSLANDVLELRPDLPDAVMARLPRNVITRALGMAEAVRASIRTLHVAPGDRYLLCSDGITGALEDEDIEGAMRVAKGCDEAVRLLIDMANESGAEDNLAAVVIALELSPGVSSFPRRSSQPSMRARKPRPAPPTDAAKGEASSPEIVIVGTDGLDDDESARIHVVPADSSSPNLLSALGSFAGPLRQKPVCARCGTSIDNGALVCPRCGTPRELRR